MRILIDGQTFSTPEASRGIGVAARRIIDHLVVAEQSHNWLIVLRHETDMECFSPEARGRLTAIEVGDALTLRPGRWPTDEYSKALRGIVRREGVDLFWTPNPLMPGVVLPTGMTDVPVVATVYDLIPLVMKQDYLNRWDAPVREEYLRRLDALPRWAERLLFISTSARDDYAAFLPAVAEKSTVVHLAVDHARLRPRLAPADGASEPFVLTVGGFDPRKNMDAALEAFAHLTRRAPFDASALKFYVVCECSDESRTAYERLAAGLGVADRLVLRGFVPDDELAELYRRCAAFFFPSRYEGFGLPVLEAMACGAPVVTTAVSSMPEVAGDTAFYCPPGDPRKMADALADALGPPGQDVARRQRQIDRARQFTWTKTAAGYAPWLRAIQRTSRVASGRRRPRVAYVSPWPPQRSGIADYSRDLVRELKQRADITLFLSEPTAAVDNFELPVAPLTALPAEIGNFGTAVYHVGNNTQFHRDIYQMAWRHPGVVVLHDYNIHPFLKDAFLDTPEEPLFYDALNESHGLAKDEYAQAADNLLDYPMSQALVRRSRAAIVHSRWVRDQFDDGANVYVVPLGGDTCQPPADRARVAAFRRRFELPPDRFVVSTLGFVNRLKRVPSMLQAIGQLVDRGYPVRLVIGGAETDPGNSLKKKIAALSLTDYVVMTGYLEAPDFDALIQASDVILSLRCPSMGETSASLLRALGRGKAVITSNFQQFAEFPDAVCWKADVNEQEVPQLVAYIEHLLCNPPARRQLERNARAFVQQHASQAIAADAYLAVIEEVLAKERIRTGKPDAADSIFRETRGHHAA